MQIKAWLLWLYNSEIQISMSVIW